MSTIALSGSASGIGAATAQLLRKLGAVDKPTTKPAGRCVEGRFGLDYATVNSAETKERTQIIEENKKKP